MVAPQGLDPKLYYLSLQFSDLKLLDIATHPAFLLAQERRETKELVLNYRATREAKIGYRNFQPGETMQFIFATPESIQTAVAEAKRMGGHLAGVVFFRWPAPNEQLAMNPDDVLLAAGGAVSEGRAKQTVLVNDGGCAAVKCVDLFLDIAHAISPNVVKYRVRSSTPLEYFLPEHNMPVRMVAPADLEVSLPPYTARGRLYLGRAVSAGSGEIHGGERAMNMRRGASRVLLCVALGLGIVWACPFDSTLRAYLDAHFWLPFAKQAKHFERKNVRRVNASFAGMAKGKGTTPLATLRGMYQQIAQPMTETFDAERFRTAVTEARANVSLTAREREEVDLIDAKIDMRLSQPGDSTALPVAKRKLEVFLRSAQTPEFLSEARGWLARVNYLMGDQAAAGKIYLDELNRNGSNLSRETIFSSLKETYGYDGGPRLLEHLEEYFDTPEHAAFAIQLATNPRSNPAEPYGLPEPHADTRPETYARIKSLLAQHAGLFAQKEGSGQLAMLGMRTALRMGDPPGAVAIAEATPAASPVREDPDFLWMLAAGHFLSHEYAAAERPLLSLFQSPGSSTAHKAAAAYGLCGVYQKLKRVQDQLWFALWLFTAGKKQGDLDYPTQLYDQSLYWAFSGWDLNLLLEDQASLDQLQTFVAGNPNLPDLRIVNYALAVRLARENRYDESAQVYQSIHAIVRAPRMGQLASLYKEANRGDLADPPRQQAKYKLAEFLASNPNRIYFNDVLWGGYQRYALIASTDSRLTGEERRVMMDGERKLKDDQEERWRAYLILRELVQQQGKTELGRKSAALALQCLSRINDRFGRLDEIRSGYAELSRLLRP